MVFGSLLVSYYPLGGPYTSYSVASLFQALLLVASYSIPPNKFTIAAITFLYLFCQPIAATAENTIWSGTVAVDIQGRVFSARYLAECRFRLVHF
jgi:hypothetical protein